MKLVINLDSTALGHSACIKDLYLTVIGSLGENGLSEGGYKEKQASINLVYGVAVHKFIDIAIKTKGDLILARRAALDMFNGIATEAPGKYKQWLHDEKHLNIVCINAWNDYILEEQNFDLVELVLPCWKCKGQGYVGMDTPEFKPCPTCKGEKQFLQPATEVTFSIKYYEDDNIIVNICGTIDKIGKFKNGCFAIGDWKTSSTWNTEEYFQQYELSRQLRMYSLALKLMAISNPDSILGRIGKTNVGCFIDAIFLDKEPNATKFIRSDVFVIKPHDLDAFQLTIDDQIKRLAQAIKTGYLPKEGIINGSCIKYQQATEKNFVKCLFWDCCRNPDNVAEALLARNFNRVQFDPLNYNEI